MSTKLKNKSFDIFWALESLCHSADKSRLLKEAYRLLKPKGRIIVADGFLLKEALDSEENNFYQKWLKGWAVPSLDTQDNFMDSMKKTGFKQIKFFDITKNIMPSSRRLLKFSLPALPLSKLAELLHLRTKIQTGNIIGAYYQYKSLSKNLWCYGIFYGQK